MQTVAFWRSCIVAKSLPIIICSSGISYLSKHYKLLSYFRQDYEKCFRFYTETLGWEAVFNIEGCYGRFKVAEKIEGLAIFASDTMAPVVGNGEKTQPTGCREKTMVSFEVNSVDEAFKTLSAKGVNFINQPTDMSGWGMRVVHLRDPEEKSD